MSAWVSRNGYLTQAEMENNAKLLYECLIPYGFTIQSISAILGNVQAESGINPGIWEDLIPYSGGYGLVQWTPYTKYSQWAGAGWENNGSRECERIAWEFANNVQWSTDYQYSVPMTANEFKTSTGNVTDLAVAFLWNYENPDVSSQQDKQQKEQTRSTNASNWYSFLVSTVAYTPRLTMGNIYASNYYTIWDYYYPDYQMPNCTAYAFGRWNELTDTRELHSRFPTGNGCDWYPQGIAKGFTGGRVPRLGSAACWWYQTIEEGVLRPSGHVGIVEQINYDSNGNPVSFITSNSAYYRGEDWNVPREEHPWFYLNTISMSNLNDPWGTHPDGYFQGFLYNENITPVPPSPYPAKSRKMPFIFYMKRHM